MFLKKQKIFTNILKTSSILILLIFISTIALSDTLVVSGDSNNPNPPDGGPQTTGFVECPEGYDCIKSEDYEEFISGLKDFTAEIGERTQFIEDVFDRFDKKIQLDEQYISDLTKIADEAQYQASELSRKLDELDKEKTAYENTTSIKVRNLEVSLAELRAVSIWQFFVILVAALVLADIFVRIGKNKKFLWRRFQELVPIRFG